MEDRIDTNSVTVPLLLNPAYTRCKSSISDELRHFRLTLRWYALDHSSPAATAISYSAFLLLTFIIPAATPFLFSSTTASGEGPVPFNQLVQLPESALAAISFFTLTAFFRDHGLRHLLLLDGLRHDSIAVRRGYARQLDKAFHCLAFILLPAFSIELAHKIFFFFSPFSPAASSDAVKAMLRAAAFTATLTAWLYRTGVFLLVCMLFRLTCELQILRFEGFYKMFEESDADGEEDACMEIFREHTRIKRQLLVTSHRYRIFIIGCLVTITVSQLGALTLVLASKTKKNFRNSGDLVVCSVVQLCGFLMCLIGAARITHRAQRVISVASRWHMSMSCTPKPKSDTSTEEKQIPPTINELDASDSSSESKFSEASIPPPSSQGTSTFKSRQALVMYLQHNGGGITIFGFALDRGLLHTLFAFEMTLVLWILSKVVVLNLS